MEGLASGEALMADNRTALDKQHSAQERAARLEVAEQQRATRLNVAVADFKPAAAGGNGIDLDQAEFIPISVNELSLIQKQSETEPGQPRQDDPVAHGMAAWARPLGRLKYYIGKFRMDAMRWKDGKRHFTSCGFIKRAVDELVDGDGKPVPMWAVYLTENDEVSTDEAEQPVAIFTRKGVRILVPLHAEAGIVGISGGIPAPASGERTHDIWSPDGYSVTQMNDGFVDAGGVRRPGNFVTYGLERPWDKGRYMATFSSDTGPIPNDQRKWEGV